MKLEFVLCFGLQTNTDCFPDINVITIVYYLVEIDTVDRNTFNQ